MLNALQYMEVIIAVLLILIVLIQQKNISLNLSTMGGGMGTITKRGPEKVMHNTTVILGTLFILNSIALFIMQK